MMLLQVDQFKQNHVPTWTIDIPNNIKTWQTSEVPLIQTSLDESWNPTSDFDQTINNIICKSKWILDLEDDWDGEGSLSYSEETFVAVHRFIRDYASVMYSKRLSQFVLPQISPAHESSIDVFWHIDNRMLLINFSTNNPVEPKFYGNSGSVTHEGSFSLDQPTRLEAY
ncbi:MAG: hypothetical protein ABJA67_13605, partial [Chthonomonadales bacterium]